MDESNFRLFMKVMETIEDENIRHSDIENTIVSILDKFDDTLTDEQKTVVLREFSKYEDIVRSRRKEKKAKDDEEEYDQMMRDFLRSQVEI